MTDIFRKFSQWFDTPPHQASKKGAQMCEHPGCQDEGVYRAPKSRYHLESGVDDWYWFCLIHIRDYNAKWSYYDNMSESEIEEERRKDATWQRPTWPLGSTASTQPFEDPLGLFPNVGTPLQEQRYSPQTPEGKALKTLGVEYPFTQEDLRTRYRVLVKKHHPDTNVGRAESDELIKKINEAYRILKDLV